MGKSGLSANPQSGACNELGLAMSQAGMRAVTEVASREVNRQHFDRIDLTGKIGKVPLAKSH
jgi:hypothetical protein